MNNNNKPFCHFINKNLSLFFVLLIVVSLFLMHLPIAYAQTDAITKSGKYAGKIIFSKGVVSLIENNTVTRLLGKGDKLYVGNQLQTSKNAKVIFKLIDGTQISLIENSLFKIKAFSLEKKHEKASLSLLKGGLRAITGSLNKNKTGQFNLSTPVASIGIRGTDFSAILCTKNCADGQSSGQQKNLSQAQVVARIVMAKGSIEALDSKGAKRQLKKHSPIYVGDTLISGNKAIAVVIFRDNTRITIQGNTQFIINDYLFKRQKSDANKADFHLIKGSLRMLTGKIGKLNREKYHFSTPTSSIGIRGTGFDLAYINPVYLFLWDGSVHVVYANGEQLVTMGQSYALTRPNGKFKQIAQIPAKYQVGPRPDSKEIDLLADLEVLFGDRESTGEPGLYLYVENGEIEVTNRIGRLNIGAGEAGFAQWDALYRLNPIPAFFFYLVTPPDADLQLLQRMSILPETFFELDYVDDGMICEIR